MSTPPRRPLVIRAVVTNKTIHWVLVDNGSSVDIIFASAFDKMGIGRERLEPVNTHLRGFSREKMLPLGLIQPSLNAIKAIPSAYHMVIKFPTANGVGMIRGDQHVARECYSASMKQKAVDSIYVDELDM